MTRAHMVRLVTLSLAVGACGTRMRTSEEPSAGFGLPAEGAAAVVFAPGVVSTGDVFASTFTPDGRTLVFTKFAPPRMTLMSSSFERGRWTPPVSLPFSGSFRDLDPAFSPDGSRLYFSSWRPSGPSAGDTTNGSDTWYAQRAGNGWSAPVRLAEPTNSSESDTYPSVTDRGVLYFDSYRSVPRRRLVYRAEPRGDGTIAEPRALPATINADSGASNLFVDPDERYAVFGAVRPEGRGSMDLYIAWRRGAEWSEPRSLGPLVNTQGTELCPFVSRDGRYLYFTRITSPEAGVVARNIYVVRFDRLRERLGDSR